MASRRLSNLVLGLFVVVFAGTTLMACKEPVPDAKIDGARQWSKDICLCKAKPPDEAIACYKDHPLPVLADAREKYTADTVESYLKAGSQGRFCMMDLERLPGFKK